MAQPRACPCLRGLEPCLKSAADQVGLMERGTAGHPAPPTVLIILCLQDDGVTRPCGGRNSAPVELSVVFLSTALGGLGENW